MSEEPFYISYKANKAAIMRRMEEERKRNGPLAEEVAGLALVGLFVIGIIVFGFMMAATVWRTL